MLDLLVMFKKSLNSFVIFSRLKIRLKMNQLKNIEVHFISELKRTITS